MVEWRITTAAYAAIFLNSIAQVFKQNYMLNTAGVPVGESTATWWWLATQTTCAVSRPTPHSRSSSSSPPRRQVSARTPAAVHTRRRLIVEAAAAAEALAPLLQQLAVSILCPHLLRSHCCVVGLSGLFSCLFFYDLLQLKANLVSSFSPSEVAAVAVFFAKRPTCMSVTQCKASSQTGLRGVSVRVAIEKRKVWSFESFHHFKMRIIRRRIPVFYR